MASTGNLSKQGTGLEEDRHIAPGLKPHRIVVIGGGSAAFAAAIRLQRADVEVTLVERGEIGGTCVNIGCVPSKILINAAHVAHVRSIGPFDGGISAVAPVVNLAALHTQQQARVDELRRTKYESLLGEYPNILMVRGEARFQNDHAVIVKRAKGSEVVYEFDHALVATGASPAIPDVEGLSTTPYWTSTEALASEVLPKHLIVYGGSYVALELAQALRRLGSKVTMIVRSRILSRLDRSIGDTIEQVLIDEGIRILTGTRARSAP